MNNLSKQYQKGFLEGIRLMEERMLLACENGTPIALSDGHAYFIRSDKQNLLDIITDLEAN